MLTLAIQYVRSLWSHENTNARPYEQIEDALNAFVRSKQKGAERELPAKCTTRHLESGSDDYSADSRFRVILLQRRDGNYRLFVTWYRQRLSSIENTESIDAPKWCCQHGGHESQTEFETEIEPEAEQLEFFGKTAD